MKKFKLVISLLMISVLVVGCGGGNGVGNSEPVETVKTFFQAVYESDAAKVVELIDNNRVEFMKEDIAKRHPESSIEEQMAGFLSLMHMSYEDMMGEKWINELRYELKEEKRDFATVTVDAIVDSTLESFEIYLVKEDGKWKLDWERLWS